MKSKFISVADFGKMLGVGRTKIYEILNQGEVITIKMGTRRLVDRKSAQDYARRLLEQGGQS